MPKQPYKPMLISTYRVRKEDGLRDRPETPKRHVCTDKCVRIDYGNGKPVCFKAYFQERREHRKLFVTDERTRNRTRSNARAKRQR